MAQIHVLLVLAITLASGADASQSKTTTTTANAPTTEPVCEFFSCPEGYDRINHESTANNLHMCCRERVSTTTKKDAKNGAQHIVSTTLAIETTKTETPHPWYEKKVVKKGLIEGAAAAGFATFAGLGVGALVMANKETTQPPIPIAARALPQTVQTTPQMTVAVIMPQSQIKVRSEDEGNSFSALIFGLLSLFVVCCCISLIAIICVFMKTGTKEKRAPSMPRHKEAEYDQEAIPFIHEPAPPPAPAAHLPTGPTSSSYVPATTVMPTEYMMPITAPQNPSFYAPATTFATGPVYAPASAYVPATTQYAGVRTPALV